MIRDDIARPALAALLAASAIAGCSSNAGFGTPPPYSGGQNPTSQPASSGGPFAAPSESPNATPSTPLTVDSATARFAYDASAADPVKASRLVEITFALANPGASPLPVSNIAVAADQNPAANVALSLQALPNQDTVETLVAVAPPKDYSKVKQLSLTFGDGKTTMLAQSSIDFPASADIAMAPLDKKAPAGGLSVDDVAITNVTAPGARFHYDATFSITNAGTSKASIAYFTLTPPKGDAVKVVVPITVPGRTQTSPMSVIVPYSGKRLPDGKYGIAASDGTSIIATGSGPLL